MKTNVNVISGEITKTEITIPLRQLFERNPNASIRKLAQVADVSYAVALKKSKDPIPGIAYDPEFVNYESVERYLCSKDVDFQNLDWDDINSSAARSTTLVKDTAAFKVGDLVYLRRDNVVPFEIIYKTETHIVIQLQGTSEPIAWQLGTFMLNGPVFQPRATGKKEGV